MSRPLPAGQVWGMPVALAAVSAVGLISALLGDGVWDALSWLALGTPIAVSLWFGLSCLCRTSRSFH
ncbi:hypothetical protein DNFV4_00716 [Nitrospira tepida]|uniref:Uncharacterized protein n=1 Tax=Nitrospira tepida TaxID=2973512 RepID=A0AA86MWE3_9BACT|nr:hypothetical protein [Nitrospira tepida]CAI4030288.1 hypothetical protein DNFV4_00716 [Nitrospira tepida]